MGDKANLLKEAAAGGEVIFSVMDRARFQAKRLILHPKFDQFIILLIMVSSVLLAVDSPNVDEDSKLKKALNITDVVFVCLFSLEAAIKMFALGIKKYFASGWNLMDFVIVVIGAIGAILELSGSATMQGGEVDAIFPSASPDAHGCESGGNANRDRGAVPGDPAHHERGARVYPVLPHLRHPGAELVHG